MRRALAAALLVLATCAKESVSLDDLLESTYQSLRRGDLEETLASAEKGRKAAAEASDVPREWAFRVAQAEVLVSQRKDAEVIALLESGLGVESGSRPVDVRALMTRGVALCRVGTDSALRLRATDDLDRAGRMARSLRSIELRGEVALRLGTCLLHQKDHVGAESQFREALAHARQAGLAPLEASATGSLGRLRTETGRYDEAAEWLRRSLALATATRADIPRAKTLQNLGWCYYNLGDFDRALGFLAEAEALAARLHLTGDRMRALMNTANAFYRKGDLDRAAENDDRALALARRLGDRATAASLLSNLGILAFERARHDEADGLLKQALEAQRALQDDEGVVKTLLNQAHVQAARGAPERAVATYREVIASAGGDLEAQWEAWSGLAVLEVRADRPDKAEAAFAEATAVMERSRDQLGVAEHRLTFFSSLRRFHDERVDFLVGAGRTDEALLVADRGRARLLSESLLPPEGEGAPTVERYRELARNLDATLLFYWTASRRSFLWEVTADAVAIHVLPGQADIARRIAAYGVDIQRSRDPLAGDAEDATWLYRVLVGPIASRSGGRIILVPDGPLHELNFETLIAPGPTPRYWIEDVTLATAPSLGLLSARAERAPGSRSLLVIGDPISPDDEFPPLAHAGREVARIAELFPGHTTVRTRADARPDAYSKGEPGRFTFIHFAAHATANRESPLDSAIVLSGREDGYKLYARDVVGQPLTAELVTLSACRSAGSRTYAGEGLVGLAWAFLGSGARNVVGGLWNVEDVSTAELMDHLYRELRAGLDPMAALRAAKLRLIHSKAVTRKPYYWAPFVIYTRGG